MKRMLILGGGSGEFTGGGSRSARPPGRTAARRRRSKSRSCLEELSPADQDAAARLGEACDVLRSPEGAGALELLVAVLRSPRTGQGTTAR